MLVVRYFLLFLTLTCSLYGEFDYRVENSNFTISQGSAVPNIDNTYLYNYDRLRFRGDYSYENYFFTLIADGVNYYGGDYVESYDFEYIKYLEADTPFGAQTDFYDYSNGSMYAKLYRAYVGYEDGKSRVIIGLQNITMGVGRIWNPTNLFNPRNTYAIEPDETFGVLGLSYSRYLSDNSSLMVVASQKADSSFKYAGQYKIFFDVTEFGISIVSSDETKMLGYEVEASLLDTGIEIRSEGAYIQNTLKITMNTAEDKEFFQGVIGADYGFVNGITMVLEALYSSEKFSYQEILLNLDSEIVPNLLYSNFYTALALSYSPTIYLDTALLYIESFNEKNSRFFSPTLTYTLNDYNSFMLGAMLQNGADGSEFGSLKNSYYFKWSLSF